MVTDGHIFTTKLMKLTNWGFDHACNLRKLFFFVVFWVIVVAPEQFLLTLKHNEVDCDL